MLLDIVVLLFLAFCVAVGFKRGLVKMLFSFGSTAVALILVLALNGPVTGYLSGTEFFAKTGEKLESKIASVLIPSEDGKAGEEEVPKFLSGITDSIKEAKEAAVTSVASTLAEIISRGILSILVGVGLFIIIKLALMLLAAALGAVFRLPVLNLINRLGGLLLGGANGVLITMVAFSVLTFFVGTSFGNWVVSQLNESGIAKIIYDNNFILRLFV